MKNNNKGFTLIEILAAITILAIISTIATVAVFRYLDRTRKSSYETMEKSICDAANNYVINEGLESDVVEAGEDGVTYDAKELMSSKYLENLMDPKNNKKVCSANVNVRVTDATLDDDAIPEYYYFVKLRCKDYSSDVGFSSGCALNKNVSDPGTDEPVVEPDDDGTGGNTPDTSDKTLYGVVAKSSNGTDAHISYLPTLSTGVYTMRETLNDNFPIHYYHGNVDNNNVVFKNFCWKIVRTTSTGGVKLLYNGVVNADGGCNNTGTASQIGKAKFNENSGSISDIGYMFGDRYNESFINESVQILFDVRSTSAPYSKNITYSNGNYTLLNPVVRTDKDDNTGYYYCNTHYANVTVCSEVYYFISGHIAILLKDGVTDPSTSTIVLSKSVTANADGTYTLSSPEVIRKIDWYNDYEKYNGYYFCRDLTSTTCENKNVITSASRYDFVYDNKYNYVYGSDVSWDGTKYTLVDTFVSKNLWSGDKGTIGKKYRYTCLNTTGVCTEVSFISTIATVSGLYVYTLKNGETIIDAMERSFANVNSSTVKSMVDSWFASHMTVDYLEDTIWCNDKNYVYGEFFGRQSPYYVPYNDRQSLLSCPNMSRDGYSVSTESGGNGLLTYPVGLLTYSELSLTGNYLSYLTTGKDWITMSPNSISGGGQVFSIAASGSQTSKGTRWESGVRPVVSLKHDIKVKSGDGTVSSPYELEL